MPSPDGSFIGGVGGTEGGLGVGVGGAASGEGDLPLRLGTPHLLPPCGRRVARGRVRRSCSSSTGATLSASVPLGHWLCPDCAPPIISASLFCFLMMQKNRLISSESRRAYTTGAGEMPAFSRDGKKQHNMKV